ncbi:DUF1835 domain-containing protein [Mucilaginibacter xinganensis]|uniref:DUF1835 domain-containing protein n=1 Tax=Mucilaginibacter xinganensis TaxID=1234841 RepID=A0A223P454_9SPHI|nr:DUF1835 domain-containing protein [Mucilaginibacter xinganensis]ASU36820.1 hypothetical protein MuYL_4937 [Mucilaginibacter xinganensis]
MNILHILNGDATLPAFEETGLDGDVVIWREVLSEGPLEENISAARFWKNREEWICSTFDENPENYQQKMLGQLSLLNDHYEVINLWFEFDLHCQANLLGVIACLEQKADLSRPSVYLICPGDFPGKENFRGMGELNGEELEYLYDNIREELSDEDFMLAKKAWKAYSSLDVELLTEFLTRTIFWGSLHFLKPALKAQLKRLQVNEHGLNAVEQKLLDIYNYGIRTKPEIYLEFWKTEKIYGMGDSEINIYLDKLKRLGLISIQ